MQWKREGLQTISEVFQYFLLEQNDNGLGGWWSTKSVANVGGISEISQHSPTDNGRDHNQLCNQEGTKLTHMYSTAYTVIHHSKILSSKKYEIILII